MTDSLTPWSQDISSQLIIESREEAEEEVVAEVAADHTVFVLFQ